jgi:glyoxylase-like metal-dependent hydrolase (beta-lactamase superfamily II)
MSTLQIIQIDASEMDNFSYLIFCPETLQGAAVDPSLWPDKLIKKAEHLGVTLKLLLNTHNHHDHIAGNRIILEQADIKLVAHPLDLPEADIPALDGTIIELGTGEIEIIHTPGHTPGSVVFKTAEAIITGDTLFVSRCGRADFPGSDPAALYTSLQKLKSLPIEIQVFPGHNYGPQKTSTVGWERKNNDYLKCPDLESFIKLRMG